MPPDRRRSRHRTSGQQKDIARAANCLGLQRGVPGNGLSGWVHLYLGKTGQATSSCTGPKHHRKPKQCQQQFSSAYAIGELKLCLPRLNSLDDDQHSISYANCLKSLTEMNKCNSQASSTKCPSSPQPGGSTVV